MRVFEGGEHAAAKARQVASTKGTITIWLTVDRDGKEIGWLYGPEEKLLHIGRIIYSRTGKVFVIAQVGTEHQHITVYQPQLQNAIKLCRFGEISDDPYRRRR